MIDFIYPFSINFRLQTIRMKPILLSAALFLTLNGFSQTVKFINPSSVAPSRGYSQAAVVDLGTAKMVIMSGQIALDPQGNLVGKDDAEKQTAQVFRNIKSIVEAAGGTMDNIVKLGYFVTDASKLQAIRTARDQFINTKTPPASTLVQVSRLFREDLLIEIEATAVIPVK
jgi:reactive intermediate/imine deaminase